MWNYIEEENDSQQDPVIDPDYDYYVNTGNLKEYFEPEPELVEIPYIEPSYSTPVRKKCVPAPRKCIECQRRRIWKNMLIIVEQEPILKEKDEALANPNLTKSERWFAERDRARVWKKISDAEEDIAKAEKKIAELRAKIERRELNVYRGILIVIVSVISILIYHIMLRYL